MIFGALIVLAMAAAVACSVVLAWIAANPLPPKEPRPLWEGRVVRPVRTRVRRRHAPYDWAQDA